MARSPLPILLFVFAATATAVAAQTPDVVPANMTADELYWKKRSEEARKYNEAAYCKDPVAELNNFNEHVRNTTLNATAATTRRSLKVRGRRGPCLATNPIDRCWRCRADWARDRKRLATCAMGFGHKTRGGLAGRIYTVTDASDGDLVNPRKGTLRYGVLWNGPLWIVFARDMVIRLTQELIVTSDKTIDGRGAQVHIVGAQITVQSVKNVIIHNVKIHHSAPHSGGLIRDSRFHFGRRGGSDGDGISVLDSSDVWIDHVSMSNCADGLIDVIDGSTAVTISNSHFTKHDHVMLFGGHDVDKKDRFMQVTLAFNHFGKELIQRMPRCRFGFFHVVNNDYTHWHMYAIGGGMNPTIISQGNRFRASDDRNAKEVTKRETKYKDESKDWVWKSQDDLFQNGAYFVQSGGRNERKYDRLDYMQAQSGKYAAVMTRFAGTLTCRVGKKC